MCRFRHERRVTGGPIQVTDGNRRTKTEARPFAANAGPRPGLTSEPNTTPGGTGRNRTCGLLPFIQALDALSYGPVPRGELGSGTAVWIRGTQEPPADLVPLGVGMATSETAVPRPASPTPKETFLRALTVAFVATLFALSTTLHGLPAHALAAHSYELQAVEVTNDHRDEHGLRRLRTDECLARFANRHAARMAQQQRLFHQDPSPVLRHCELSRVGENVAYGYSNGRTVVSGWMRSPGHRANILAPPFRLVAVGAVQSDTGRWYTAQVLGRH